MGQLLKQSTARTITILIIDETDHISGKTGLSAGLTIYASKNGAAPASIAPTVTELDASNTPGLYSLQLTTSHTDTLGELQLHVTGTGADPTDVSHQVVVALPGEIPTVQDIVDGVWDEPIASHLDSGSTGAALNGAGSAGDPWSTPIPGAYGAGTAGFIVGTNLDDAISAVLTAIGALPTAGENADAVWDEAAAGHVGAGSFGEAIGDIATGITTLLSRLTSGRASNLDNLDATVSSVLTAIDALPTAAENATELLDQSAGVETNRTVRQALRLILAALAGRLSGAATTTVTIRDTNNTKNRIVADVDSSGNRTSIAYDAS